jgi:catechol 2,3-dioxygenase-like lactoylglutathione lyase family enzyme
VSLDQSSAAQPTGPIGYAGHMTAAIGVSDMERSRSWFQELLGFEPIYTLVEWGWCELRTPIPGVNLGIGQEETLTPQGGATLTFGVTDIAAARAHLERNGVRFDGATREIEGMVRLAIFYDLDGNSFMLAQRLERDEAGRGA